MTRSGTWLILPLLSLVSNQSSVDQLNRRFSSLIALIAAAMLTLQVPLCACANESHDHAAPNQAEHGREALPHHDMHGSGGDRGHSHPAGHFHRGDSHDADHSHHAGPCHVAGHSNSAPPSEHGDEHAQCECVPTQPVSMPESAVSVLRYDASCWQLAHVIGDATTNSAQVRASDLFHFGRVRNPRATFQGNPCALFCRWLI